MYLVGLKVCKRGNGMWVIYTSTGHLWSVDTGQAHILEFVNCAKQQLIIV